VDGEEESDGEVLIYVLDLVSLDFHELAFGDVSICQHLSAFVCVWKARDTAQHLLDELTSIWPRDLM
jgi:hypothetical protein